MKHEFIGRERSCHSVEKMCLVLGVSRSGYYAHGRQDHGIRRKANERMLEEIKRSYKVGRGAYGSPRITTDLRERGYVCGKNRVARLMQINGIAASDAFRGALTMYGIIQSMSAKGDCHDNAVAESFFHALKTEYAYFAKFKTRAEARSGIFEYIEVFHNRIRRHSTLGNISPRAFEQAKAA